MSTLFLNPPSFNGFDGGAGSRYQARREVRSFWYPTWLAQPAALVPDSRLLDCPPHGIAPAECLKLAEGYDHIIIHTSTPSFRNDSAIAEQIKARYPATQIGMVGPHAAVLPEETLQTCPAVAWVGRNEFDYTCRDVAQGRPLSETPGLTFRDDRGRIQHNPDRQWIRNMDQLPWVVDVYQRDLQIENYSIGYLHHPYLSFYTGRGCPARCTFCLWPQTIGGHEYRVRSADNVASEVARATKLLPQVREFFFDDDTFTANLPRAIEIARRLKTLGVTWSCNTRANLSYQAIRELKECGLRLFLVGYESGNQQILNNIRKGIRVEQAQRFTRDCRELGVVIHGTFILGLPGEDKSTIEQTIQFARDLDLFSLQVSLAAPYPGTELYDTARKNGWLSEHSAESLVHADGMQQSALQYPQLTKEEAFAAVEEFYRRFYLRPRPILRILRTMLEDKSVFVRRMREGYEFFRTMSERRQAT